MYETSYKRAGSVDEAVKMMGDSDGGKFVAGGQTLIPTMKQRLAAPDALIADKVVDGEVVRSRPLCPYPQVARYDGDGSIDEAANFTCRAP